MLNNSPQDARIPGRLSVSFVRIRTQDAVDNIANRTEEVIAAMGMHRDVLERQLKAANALRDQAVKQLCDQGKTEKEYRKDPQWRQLDSKCRQLTRRLGRVGAKEEVDANEGGDE